MAPRRLRARPRIEASNYTAALLGLKKAPRDDLEWAELAQTGLSSAAVDTLAAALGWTREKLAKALDLVPRTVARRLARGERLTVPESERVLRVARVLARANDVLEGEAKAKTWLEEPSMALAGRAPIDLLRTDIGTEVVLTELLKIDHGMWA
jgi:putative toxin-antitoxin system antitoxin component (TIGR02293 family)